MPRVPRLLAEPNKLRDLSPPEAYLLSRVDGLLNELDLALVTGMTPAESGALLERLAKLGAVELVEERAPPEAQAAPASSTRAGAAPLPWLRFDGPPPYDPAELEEVVDLEPDRKRYVLDLFYRLDELTYYDLLGVAGDVDKKQVKTAYYAVAPEFHPDKYFRKQLGTYKPKIEAIFARITLAHDVLTAPKRRAEYDEYLEQTQKNRKTSAVLDQTKQDVEAILAAVERAAAEALAAQRVPTIRPPMPSSPSSSPGFRPSDPGQPPTSQPPLSDPELLRQRREALPRRLTGGRRPLSSRPAASVPPPEADPAAVERAAEVLRQRHEAALVEARQAQINRYIEAGRASIAAQDYASAANSYRIAASLAPDDAAVQATCNEALRVVAVALADGYWKQALYEEGQERWAEAALSYSKVCTGRPDNAQAHERVAYATLKSSNNARRAVEFARRAIELDPKKPEYRITLARAYAAAGFDTSASNELDRALEIGKGDPRLQAQVAAARAAMAVAAAAAKEIKNSTPPPGSQPEKPGGLSGFLRAVRSAIAPKESK
jgi:curved DNA-binding protein CbpA